MKIKVANYTFNAALKTITFNDYASLNLDQILLITNTTDNIIIYNFANNTLGGSIAANVLTLAYNTTSMSNSDALQIFIEDNVGNTLGDKSDTSASSDTGTFSLIALIKRALTNWTTLLAKVPSLGQATMANSSPVVIASNQTNVPVSLPNGTDVIGTAGLSAINTDLLTNSVNGWYDAAAFQSGAIQIIASAGISAGAIFFEQTNNNASTTGLPLIVTEVISINTNPQNTAITIAANANRMFRFGINARYIRVRISTAFVGGTVQAIGFFSEFPFSSPAMYVQQAAAANFAVTLASTTLTAGTAAVGDVGIQYRANATGAATITNVNCPATPAAQQIKSGAGRITAINLHNNAATTRWLKFFNVLGASVTPGTTSANFEIGLSPGQTFEFTSEGGLGFATAFTIMITGGQGLTNNTAVTAGEVTGYTGHA